MSSLVVQIVADRAESVNRLFRKEKRDTRIPEGIDKNSQIEVLFEVHRIALHVRVRTDISGDAELVKNLALDRSPAVTRIGIKLNLEGLGFSHLNYLYSTVNIAYIK